MKNLSELLQNKVLIVAGTGGVGKTTISAALAVLAAEIGKKVVVLTIDPAQRLKTTLGLDQQSSAPQLVKTTERGGQLWASLLKPQDVFDDFVRLLSKEQPRAEAILNNKLYQQLSTTLSGSQEFTALEKLFRFAEHDDFDLIIVDTPPAQHLTDFLEAPKKLGALFDEQIMKWFRPQSARGRFMLILSLGTKKVLSVLERLTGAEFIAQLADFFEHVASWGQLFQKRMSQYELLLRKPSTSFVVVTGPDPKRWPDLVPFYESLKHQGFHGAAIIVNQARPNWLDILAQPNEGPATSKYFQDAEQTFQQRDAHLHRNFTAFANLISLWLVPELKEEVYDLAGVHELQKVLANLAPYNSTDQRL